MFRLSRSLMAATAVGAVLLMPGVAGAHSGAPPRPPAVEQHAAGLIEQFRQVLQQYGRYQQHPRYGEVWTPDPGVVPAGWRPYPVCHWIYDRQHEAWFFNDRTPWGEIVHHYGRWAFDAQIGWMWIAGEAFSPGWVAWRATAQTVSWAALLPVADGSQEPPAEHWHSQDARSFNAGCREAAPAPVATRLPPAAPTMRAPTGPRTAYVPVPAYVPGPVEVAPPVYGPQAPVEPGGRYPGPHEPRERDRFPPGQTQTGNLPPLRAPNAHPERGPRVTPAPPSQQGPLRPGNAHPERGPRVSASPVRPEQVGRLPSYAQQRTAQYVERLQQRRQIMARIQQRRAAEALSRLLQARAERQRAQNNGGPLLGGPGWRRGYARPFYRPGTQARFVPRIPAARPGFARPAFRPSLAGPSRSVRFVRSGRR